MLLLIAVLFCIFLIIGIPVAFALMLASIPVFVLGGTMPPTVAIQKMVTALENFPLLAVPFFILAGNLMNATGITDRLVRFSRLLTGWMAGGLAQVSIVLSFMMGGISGSAVADASMEARLLGPSMKEQGYSTGFIAAVLAFGSVITATIPPAIGLILFGFINEVSIGRLFLAGIIPGAVLAVILMFTSWVIATRRGYVPDIPFPARKQVDGPFLSRDAMLVGIVPAALLLFGAFGLFSLSATGQDLLLFSLIMSLILYKEFRDSIWAIVFPIFLIIGFRGGYFTATEAGVFLVFYAAFIGVVVYRELTISKLIGAFRDTMSDLGMVMLLIMMAAVLGYAMTIERAPQQITEYMTSITEDPAMLLLIVCGILVVSGMFLEGAANILLVTPIVMPVLTHAGFDEIHMGILIVTLINFGGLTPPVGVIMFTVCGILGCKTGEFTRASIPFFIAMAVFFLLLAMVPGISLFLPTALM